MRIIFMLLFLFGSALFCNAQDITSDLEVHYKFDFQEGSEYVKDHSGNNRDLRPMKWGIQQDWNNLQWGTADMGGESRNYLYFPTARDADIVLTNTADNHWMGIGENTARTVCAWIKIGRSAPEYTGQYLLLSGDENQTGGCFNIALKGHSIEFENAINNAGNDWANRNVAWLNDGNHPQETWHHLALIYDGIGDRKTGLKLYLNGVELSFNPVSQSADFSINTIVKYAPEIGRNMQDMAIADYRIYSRALTINEINLIRGVEAPSPFTIANLKAMIQSAVDNNETRLVIPPGVYKGPAPFLNIKNAKNLEIIADGVTMLCETQIRALEFQNCENVKLKGLTIDYNPLTFTQGDIVAVGANYVDVKIHEGYPLKPYSRIDVIDPKTRFRKRGSKFVWESTAELREGNIVRVFQPELPSVAKVGDMATMSTGPEGQYGAPHALVISNCLGGMVLEDVSIHSAPGFGIFESEGVGGTHLKNCNVVPGATPEGATEERMLSTSWDAIQHTLLKKGPLVEGCVVKDAGDDSWSVTWNGSFLIASVNDNRITVDGDMSAVLQAGDTLRTSLNSEYAVIDRKSGITILLKAACPWPTGTRLYSPNRRCESFILRNNHFRSSGRVLVKASHGLIENNLIEEGHSGVTINSEDAITAMEDIVIRNNTISGSGHFMPASWSNQAGSISIASGGGGNIDTAGKFNNIRIENNRFSDISGVNIVVTSSQNIKIKGNQFYKTGIPTPNNTGSDFNIDQNTVVYLNNVDVITVDSNAVINRGLNSLTKEIGVTNQTKLRGGVFDATDDENSFLEDIIINGAHHDIKEPFVVPKDHMGNTVTVKIVPIENATVSINENFDVNIAKPTRKEVKFTITSPENEVQEYTLVVEKYFNFEAVVKQRWNNTLSVINNPANNDNYTFVAYKWFKNGAEVGDKQYYSAGSRKNDLLNENDTYYAQMTTNKGEVLRTWEGNPILQNKSIYAYPNVVSKGETVYLEITSDEDLLKGCPIQIYNISGLKVSQKNVEGKTTSLAFPSVSGIYFLKLGEDNNLSTDLKVIVK
ncbi:LamG-like jellyroll fold domain-containing protein [Dysgonomonas reticulitermitis]